VNVFGGPQLLNIIGSRDEYSAFHAPRFDQPGIQLRNCTPDWEMLQIHRKSNRKRSQALLMRANPPSAIL
jgi:hypothetical protein